MRELQANGVCVVFCSSKTRVEQETIRHVLSINDPFIIENGSAIVIPPNTLRVNEKCKEEIEGTKILSLGTPIKDIRVILKKIESSTGIIYQSFYDLSVEHISKITNLDLESAQLAKAREFSETIVSKFTVAEAEIFVNECRKHNLNCMSGGRFWTVTGKGADKGKAVRLLTKLYKSQFCEVVTVGIGDSPNDAPMLRAVDFPYLVQRPNGQWKSMKIKNLNQTPAIGPLGFTEMVKDIMRFWSNNEF